jgi:hypothetical protein
LVAIAVVPAVLGISLGLLSSALDLVFHWTQFFAQFSGLPAFNAPWPGSLLLLHGRRNPGRGVLSTAAGAAAGVARLELAATRSRPGAGLLDPAGPTVPVASVQPAVYPFNSAELLRLERYRAAIRAGLYNDWPIDSSVERLHSISDVIHALELD